MKPTKGTIVEDYQTIHIIDDFGKDIYMRIARENAKRSINGTHRVEILIDVLQKLGIPADLV